jgi:hypothetical protein
MSYLQAKDMVATVKTIEETRDVGKESHVTISEVIRRA